jgi:subtilase family serine protease
MMVMLVAFSITGTSTTRGGVVARIVPLSIVASTWKSTSPPTTASCLARSAGRVYCYQPAQIQTAYNLAPLFAKGDKGAGQTIVIIDAYGSPTIIHDLIAFDTAFHLPAPPSFRIITPVGRIPAYSLSGTDRAGWATETSLDVEWAHVLAPSAKILLVETPTDEVEGTSGFPDIVRAENYVITHKLGTIISQSFAATESTFTSLAQITPLRTAYEAAKKANVTVLAGTGDAGATDFLTDVPNLSTKPVIAWPSSDPLVTAVGGTTLTLNASGTRLSPDVVWNDSKKSSPPRASAGGGGLSIEFARPSYQNSVAAVTGAARGVPDISMSASCFASVDVYESFAPNPATAPWQTICGTSEATPLMAGIVALADQAAGHSLGLINPDLYAMTAISEQRNRRHYVGQQHGELSQRQQDHLVTVHGYAAGTGLRPGVRSGNGERRAVRAGPREGSGAARERTLVSSPFGASRRCAVP